MLGLSQCIAWFCGSTWVIREEMPPGDPPSRHFLNQPTVGGALKLVLSSMVKQTEQPLWSKPGRGAPPWLLHQLLSLGVVWVPVLTSFSNEQQCKSVSKPSNHFPPFWSWSFTSAVKRPYVRYMAIGTKVGSIGPWWRIRQSAFLFIEVLHFIFPKPLSSVQ